MRGTTIDRSLYRFMVATFLRLGAAVAVVGLALGVGLGATCSSAAAQGDLLNGSGSFESGNLNPPITATGPSWSSSVESYVAHDGTYSVAITRNSSTSGNGYVYIPITFTKGWGYVASVWIKGTSSSAGKPYNIVLEFPDNSRATGVSVNAVLGSWVNLTVKGTATASGSGNIYITDDPQTSPSARQAFWLDQITIEALPDALWAQSPDGTKISVCKNPTDPASISSCFSEASLAPLSSGNAYPPVTDGTNVYIGNYRCPVADYGQSCTKTQSLAWEFDATRVAAANGYLWLGSRSSTSIYRCPSDLTYTGEKSMPAECELFATPVNSKLSTMGVWGLVYANGKLYVGVGTSNGGGHVYLFSCDANQPQDCTLLDELTEYIQKKNGDCDVSLADLAVGGGYVWLALDHVCDPFKQKIMRCDPVTPNSCQAWDEPGQALVSLADDGEGTLWAAASNNHDGTTGGDYTHPDDVIWSCSQASTNGCADVINNVHAYWVTAGLGRGFSSFQNGTSHPTVAYGGTLYPQSALWGSGYITEVPQIVYVPGGGPVGLGGVRLHSRPRTVKVSRLCAWRGTLPVTVHLRGPHKLRIKKRANLCAGRSWVRKPKHLFSLLYPGAYTLRVRSSELSGSTEFVVTANRTTKLAVKLRARRR